MGDQMFKSLSTSLAVAALFSFAAGKAVAIDFVSQILANNGGTSVAISGEWALVGDSVECEVYAYRFDNATKLWGDGQIPATPDIPHSTLSPKNGCNNAPVGGFGAAVSIADDLAVIGAPLAKDGGPVRHGLFFFFIYNSVSDTWEQDSSIGEPVQYDFTGTVVTDFQTDAGFGGQVSIRTDEATGETLILAGAKSYDGPNGVDAGRAYFYSFDASRTPEVEFIGTMDGEAAGDEFGTTLTSNGDFVVAGAPKHDNAVADSGKVYIVDVDQSTVPAVINLDEVVPGPAEDLGGIADTVPGLLLGNALSLSAQNVLMIGSATNGVFVLEEATAGAPYLLQTTIPGTNDGDVSQSFGQAAAGFQGSSVQIWVDNTNISPVADVIINEPLAGVDYAFDISLSNQRIMVSDDTNERAFAYYTLCGYLGDLKALKWTMIGQNCDLQGASGAATIGEVFNASLGVYGSDWFMMKQNGSDYEGHQNAYVAMAEGDVMELGVGYWIISAQDAPLAIDGNTVTLNATPSVADPLARPRVNEVYSLDLKPLLADKATPGADIRVMLANPFPLIAPWSATVMNPVTGGVQDAASVDNATDQFELGAAVAYTWDPVNSVYVAHSSAAGMPNLILPGQGFFTRFSGAMNTELSTADEYLFQVSEPR
jgi:FG-GAP repeat